MQYWTEYIKNPKPLKGLHTRISFEQENILKHLFIKIDSENSKKVLS
jgi:hypothetical protein